MLTPRLVRPLVIVGFLSIGACQSKGESNDEVGEEAGPDNPNDPCNVCLPGEYAVDCGYLWGLGEFPNAVCGIDKETAETQCTITFTGVVLASPSDNCDAPSVPWEPGIHIDEDPASGVIVIESKLLARIEDSPQDIYFDGTRLDWNDAGEVVIRVEGELSDALGLQLDDVLLDVNGHAIATMLGTARVYQTLQSAEQLVLRIGRDGFEKKLVYEIR